VKLCHLILNNKKKLNMKNEKLGKIPSSHEVFEMYRYSFCEDLAILFETFFEEITFSFFE